MLTLYNYIIFSSIIFVIGLVGTLINRKNFIILLMCFEIILLSINTNFIIFSRFMGDFTGQIFVFFILATASVEAAIGLAISIIFYRKFKTLNIKKIKNLKG